MLCLLVATTSFVPHYASRAAVMSRVGTISAVTKKDIVTSELTEAVLECLVDAENEAEQGACLGVAAPVAAEKVALIESVDECIVDAENAAEIAACSDTSVGTTYSECVVAAENEAEIADCLSSYVEVRQLLAPPLTFPRRALSQSSLDRNRAHRSPRFTSTRTALSVPRTRMSSWPVATRRLA